MVRGGVGAAAVGVIAGALFLIKPEIFQKFGVGKVINGTTTFIRGGQTGTLKGLHDAASIAAHLQKLSDDPISKGAIRIISTSAEETKYVYGGTKQVIEGANRSSAEISKALDDVSVQVVKQPWYRPMWEWGKQFGMKIAPITAAPAYASASTYYSITSDFSNITKPNTTFTRPSA
jgi:hypothetical protein